MLAAGQAASRADALEAKVQAVEARAREIESRAKDIEARAKEAAERIVDAERRAREAQGQLAAAVRRAEEAEAELADAASHETQDRAAGAPAGLERKLAEAQAEVARLQHEVDAAENVRQFAANTEREIAQLERELRETKAKVTQITLERDRLESQLRDVRDDSETENRPVPPAAAEAGAQAELSRYTALVARAGELEQKLARVEKADEQLRRQLAEAEARLAAQGRAEEDEPTSTGNALPIQFAEHLSMLEDSIESLRANLRAASDETAMMDPSDSVIAVSSAVSSAAEHVERARDSLRLLAKLAKTAL